ncbi:hypothetical protein, variant [Aphanomyces invadans]|uniref:Uncharacterized protein n=1 Tax=Aphanomyces invadans TaxID=157072 RepID=A0A024UAV1_9STRA|nr:hypothetical protein, variant [Aphanomyces invadans]ETW03541.1 hypothetical protein, variant [Aphanomyces invadans]|eukprot:XP_008867770.1 hypothetical protein, variant [Aphanomyces invadans]
MIQQALALMLQRLLGKFLTLDSSQLNLSIWDGDLTFKNIQLKLGYGRGDVGELQIQVPWRSLWSQPVVIKAQHIRIYAHANSEPPDGTTQQTAAPAATDEQDKTYLSKLLACIVGNVQIELDDIVIQYECNDEVRDKAAGYAVCSIDRVELQNVGGDWVPTFVDPNQGGNVSRKRLQIYGISSYVVLYSDMSRYYFLHNWSSDIKVTLSYQSASATVPDVDVQLGFSSKTTSALSCKSCAKSTATANHLPVHIEYAHIDVLSAILGEVKAPFDQYGQFSKLTPSKVQGFALVLTYAKQWLLSDCIDDSSNGKTSYSDDDEDDVFEDAIAPPSLSVRMALETPLEISVIPRDAVANLHWSSFVDGVQFQWRQTCVETEIQVGICSILVQEIDDERQDFIVQHRVVDSTPCIQFSCTLPELESLRVGAPTRVTCWMDNALTIKLSDKCVTEWGVLASPLWEWYETWDQQQPTVAQNQSTTNETESLVVFDIRLNSLKATVNVTPSFFLGAQVDSLSFQTNSSDTDMTTTMAVTTFDVFSSQSTMLSLEYISATLIRRSHLKTDGACRCNHMFSNVQSVPTIRSSNSNGFGLRFSKNMDEYSLYSFIAKLPSIHLSVNETEYVHMMALSGMASRLLGVSLPQETPSTLSTTPNAPQLCWLAMEVTVPDVVLSLRPWGEVVVKDVAYTSTSCTRVTMTTTSIGALTVSDLRNPHIQVLSLHEGLTIDQASCPRSAFEFSNTLNLNDKDANLFHIAVPERIQCSISDNFIKSAMQWITKGKLHVSLSSGITSPTNPRRERSTSFVPRDITQCLSESSVWLGQGFVLDVYHEDVGDVHRCNICADKMLHLASWKTSFATFTSQGYGSACEVTSDVRGTLKNLQLNDCAHTSTGVELCHRAIVSGTRDDNMQHVDFRLAWTQDSNGPKFLTQVRLDAVAMTYLLRVHKQLDYFCRHHLYYALYEPLSSIEVASVYAEYTKSIPASPTNEEYPEIRWEVVAHDLSLSLPRNSCSNESVVLRSSSAKFQSSPEATEFLRSGLFIDEGVDDIFVETVSRRQELRRLELRHLRRIVKNQRAKLLVTQARLHADYKTATRESQRFMHGGGRVESLLQAEQACSILKAKLESVDEHLEELHDHLKFIESEIEATKVSEDEVKVVGRYRSRSLDLIQNSVAKIPEYTAGSLFGAEDAAFHDAADEDVTFSATPWLSFELIGLSGWTVDPVSGGFDTKHPIFQQAMAECTIDFQNILHDANVAYSVQNIGIRFNEWSLELLEYQYGTIIGMIYENFKEANNIVSENLWSRCASCGGFHDDSAVCNVDWLRVTIDVLDASLTLHKTYSTPETSTKMDLEQLSIQVAMKTSDELDIDVSVMSLNVSDVHELIQDYIKPTQSIRDVPQVRLASTSTYTDSKYTVQVGHSHIVILPKSLQILSSFFTWPFWMAEDKDETVFVAGPVVEWEIMEVAVIFDKACCFYLLENFAKVDTRALVLMSEIKLDYTWSQSAPDKTSSTKFDLAMQPRGLYFSTLPDLAVDVDFPLMNSFTFQYMHLMEYVLEPSLQATQRYALSLYAEQSNIHAIPVEARLSVQDFLLLANIGHNYANTKANSVCGPELTTVVETPRVLSDKFLADIGGLRVVMVNNSLGVPILDVVMSEIGCEYENTGDAVMIVGGIFRCNYFNNSIYRWEPLIEPFKIQSDIVLSKSLTMQLNFPFAFNFNLTPAMTPILFMDNLLLTDDIVASGAKVTTPFWLKNSLGTSVKFSFAHGQTFIQDTVEHSQVVPIDCRDKVTHLRSFDKASELDALLYQKNSLTAQHSLFIWVTGSMWMSAHPVTVDVVGHISICLKLKDDATAPPDENVPCPVIAAEISLQEDGSKLIHIHSQVLIANETSLPLIVWGYAPPGMIEEWIVDRESTSYVPLHLIHPEARLSVRPSLDTDYAPLASTFGEFDMDIKSSQLSFDTQRKRFIRTGTCICKHKPNDSTSAVMAMQLLPGMVVRELPPWHCVFDVEAFALINTAVDSSATTLRRGSTTVAADSEEDDIDVFEALLKLEDEESSTLAKSQPVVDVLEEAKQAKHVQGMKLEHFAHVLTLKPCLTLHNRLACPVAYRILEQSLQLVAEGILGVGAILPLFQINLHEEIFVSYRLENYNWSEPVTMVHPKHCPLPYKESILSIRITGRTFPDAANYKNAQVPELQLKLKRRDRDVIVYSPLWIVNHAGMPLEYCDALSRKSLETALTFVHNRPASLASTCFVRRQTTLTSPMAVPEDFHLFEKSASIVPVAIYVVVKEARNLINSHKFVGTQNPYIRASLFIPKQTKNEDLVDSLFCFAMTRAHIGGGQNPKFKMNNTMYLPFPEELGTYQLQFARIVVEVRSVWYGSESLLGIVTLPLSEVMSNRDVYAGFQWHELVKKKSSSKKGPAEAVSAGQVEMSITLATKHFIENHAESDNMWGTVLTTPRQQMRKSLQSHGDTAYNLTVYLPTNRFTSVEVSVLPSTTVMEIVKKVANLGGFIMAPDDYILVELLLPRFVSLRSAGRPEAERWFGSVLTDKLSPIQVLGKKFGVHLCHRSIFNTIRLYDESSTASIHHTTPRSLLQHRQPAQNIPVEWAEAINFGSKSGSSWDSLRVKTFKSGWSDAVRIHRNALGNSGVAQLLTLVEENEQSRLNPSKQIELALWSSYGPGAFSETIVTTIVPRYVLINQTSHPLWYRQHNCHIVMTLHVNDMKPFHWDKADEQKKRIEVTFAEGEMDWSGPFTIHSLGSIYLKLRGKSNVHSIYILQAQLDMVGGSIVCVFRDESKRWPPYRIDNFTSFRLQFHQTHWNKDVWDEVQPRSSVPYSWDNHEGRQVISADGNQTLVLERYLDVRFMQVSSSLALDVSNAVVDTKEYNLDMMQKHKRIQLTRSLPASLFDGCPVQGALLKKDNAINWSKRYFRLHDHMVYYFMTENDHALRGVIDLGVNQLANESAVLYLKGWSKQRYKQTQFTKVANPLQSMAKSITETLFGEEAKPSDAPSSQHCEEYFLWIGTLIRMSDMMVTKATQWLQALTLNGTELSPSQLFLASGTDVVQFLLLEQLASNVSSSLDIAQQLLYYGVLGLWNPPPDIDFDNIQFESGGTLYRVLTPTPAAPSSREFSISTPGKTYHLRADSPEDAAVWCRSIRDAIIHAMHKAHTVNNSHAHVDNGQQDSKTTTKTYVYARVRADGPTKVLEFTEGGEEDEEYGMMPLGQISRIEESPTDTNENAVEWLKNVHLSVNLTSIGLSCVNEKPMELIYMSLQGVGLTFVRNENKMRFGVTWQDIQADNQVPEATFQTLLCSKQREVADELQQVCRDCGTPQYQAAFHFCCGWSNEQGSTDYFEYCSVYIAPILLQLDEELVSLIRDFIAAVLLHQNGIHRRELSDTIQSTPFINTSQVQDDFKLAIECEELDPLNSSRLLETHTVSSSERKVYFAVLNIHPVELDITFRSDVIGDRFKDSEQLLDDEVNLENVAAWIPSLSMHVPDLDNAPIRLNALVVEHAFGTSSDVTRRVSKYYTRQLWKQVHKVLGSFDFLGNPAGLLDHLGTAVRDLIVEPFEGARAGTGIAGSGLGFGKGLAKGATSFVTNFIDGTSDATSKVTGTFGQGLATMSLDGHYQKIRAKARRRHVYGFKEGIIQGSKELTIGMVEGVTGVVMNPLRGAQTNGPMGFLKGTVTGLLGLPMKPVAGVFDFASRATQGIRNRSVHHGRRGYTKFLL